MNPADLLVHFENYDKIRLGGYLLPAEDFSMSNFMRFDLGMSWLHPGGISSTENLLAMLNFERSMRILDLGTGVGSTARLIAKRYNCEVVGIDRDPSMIVEALARNSGRERPISFQVMDGNALGFADNSFDGAIVQSVLCFNDKQTLLRELARVLKPGGWIGVNESTWLAPPTPETALVTRATVCETFQEALETNAWISQLLEAGFGGIKSRTYEFTAMSPYQMLREEGLVNTVRVFAKVLLNAELNMRLSAVSTYFKTFHGCFGYGLFTGIKPGA